MKKTLLKSFFMGILAGVGGAGLGLLGWIILAGIALPAVQTTILTKEEIALLSEGLGTYNFFLSPVVNIIIAAMIIIAAVAYIIIFLKSLNPNFGFRWFRTHTLKMILIIILPLICCGMIVYIIYKPVPMGFPGFAPLSVLTLIIGAVVSGVVWSIVSKTEAGSEAPSIIIAFFTGVIAFVVWGILGYFASLFCFNWIFNLVTTVWGIWGEANLHGLFIFLYAMIPSYACMFAIAGGFALVLNPIKMNMKTRFHFFIIPLILIIGVLIFIISFYNNAAKKYDFDKKTLAKACGVSEYAKDTLTVIFFGSKEGEPIVGFEKWPLSVSAMSFIASFEVDVSMASLRKIEEYVDTHPNHTLFTRSAKDALWRGYERNWMMKQATEYHFISTYDFLISRMLFLLRLRKAPITEETVSYIEHFSDETNYDIGKNGARTIALVYNHIGMPDKAKHWAIRSEEPEKIEISEHPLITHGIISGKIILNQEPFQGKIALFSTEQDIVTSMSGIMNTVDATETENGFFSFENIGEGKYYIAVMVKTEEEPTIEVKNNPGVFKISSKTPKLDLGEINISIK